MQGSFESPRGGKAARTPGRVFFPLRGKRKRTRGAAVLESVIVMLMLMLILFGFLQLFHISVAQILADYAAFRGARSASVGFRDYLVRREGRIKSIPASGRMIEPRDAASFGSQTAQFYFEKEAIRRYSAGTEYLDYEYWNKANGYHDDYRCPLYGKSRAEASGGCTCRTSCSELPSVSVSVSRTNESVRTRFLFDRYPMNLPLREAFTGKKNMDISADVQLTNYASSWLE